MIWVLLALCISKKILGFPLPAGRAKLGWAVDAAGRGGGQPYMSHPKPLGAVTAQPHLDRAIRGETLTPAGFV